MHRIHVSAAPDVDVNLPNIPPSSKEQETDDEFLARLDQDSNVVASTKQRHSKNHSHLLQIRSTRNWKKGLSIWYAPRSCS